MPKRPHWWFVNIDSGDGSLPSNTRSFSEPMLTKLCNVILRHYANNELIALPNDNMRHFVKW